MNNFDRLHEQEKLQRKWCSMNNSNNLHGAKRGGKTRENPIALYLVNNFDRLHSAKKYSAKAFFALCNLLKLQTEHSANSAPPTGGVWRCAVTPPTPQSPVGPKNTMTGTPWLWAARGCTPS